MEFQEFKNRLQKHFKEMTKNTQCLFAADVDKEKLWNLYQDSYPGDSNPIFRTRRRYDCSCCRQFIKSIGNAVVIKENQVETLWDLTLEDAAYQTVANTLSAYIKEHTIKDVYLSKWKKIGTDSNFQQNEDGSVMKWNHFCLELPDKFVNQSPRSVADIQGTYRDTKQVFRRSLEEISEESLCTVLELIAQNSLYKGEEWRTVLKEFLAYKKNYDRLVTDRQREIYAWEQSVKAGPVIGRIRNHSMGVLLLNISEGMDLDVAVRKYEQIVAPVNYQRPKPIYTKKMLEEARKTITQLGYMDSLQRRYATLDDITVNNILFSNKDAAARMQGSDDIFKEMEQDIVINPKKFTRVEEIPITDFISNVLPTARELEALLENRHAPNMVSLIAPQHKDSKTMFKWNNGFGWAYTGNITDSSIKARVKSAGGRVDGDLRFSIQWNDKMDWDRNDLDAHCIEPSKEEIFFSHKQSKTKGMLDVDIINPQQRMPAVENITWQSRNTMEKGTYQFFVHQYTNRGGREGFRAEIEFDGQIYSFSYDKELTQNQNISVADVYFDGTNFTIKEKLPANVSSREIWNLKTNQFVPVSVVMYSPNYWDEQDGIGNRHYFFMLKDCINSEQPNGFYNEFLKQELIQHKRVLEALGSKMAVDKVEEQLSGLGFSSTKRNELLVKVKGASERILKIKF